MQKGNNGNLSPWTCFCLMWPLIELYIHRWQQLAHIEYPGYKPALTSTVCLPRNLTLNISQKLILSQHLASCLSTKAWTSLAIGQDLFNGTWVYDDLHRWMYVHIYVAGPDSDPRVLFGHTVNENRKVVPYLDTYCIHIHIFFWMTFRLRSDLSELRKPIYISQFSNNISNLCRWLFSFSRRIQKIVYLLECTTPNPSIKFNKTRRSKKGWKTLFLHATGTKCFLREIT